MNPPVYNPQVQPYAVSPPPTGQSTRLLTPQESRERRQRLSESFQRAAQSLEEATLNAIRMAQDLERQGHLLKGPSSR